MFTTGSKLFIGATSLSLVGVLVYAATTDGPAFMPGVVGLITATVLFAFLAGLNLATRDGNVSAADEGAAESCAASRRPAGSSLWPLVAAVGVGGLVVGTVSKPVVFKAALVLVLAAAVEWMVQGWSERASADGSFNRNVRRRMLFPLEFPILGVAVFAVIAYAFSRIMLRLEKQPGMVAFGVIAALVLFGGFMFASRRNVSKQVIGGITAVFTLALVGVGVASAVQGQRPIEEHPTTADEPELCLEGGYDEHVDDHSTRGVSAQSGVVATIRLQEDDTVVALVNGFQGVPQSSLTIPRGAKVTVLFENLSSEPHRLTARLGTYGDSPEMIMCTNAIEEGHTAYLGLRPAKGSAGSSTPVQLFVPGLEGAQPIELIVP